MKHILNIACLVAVVLFAAGCRDTGHDVSDTPTFNIVSADVSYSASGGSGTIEFESLLSATPTITVSKDWCHATISGNKVNITVDGHGDPFSREAELTITLNGYKRVIGLYQSGTIFYANNEEEGIVAELGYGENDELRIPIKLEGIMDVEVLTYPDWVEVNFVEEVVTRNDNNQEKAYFLVVKALANNGLTARTGSITVKVGYQNVKITFTQAPSPLDYYAYLGNWTMTYRSAANYGGDEMSVDLVFAVNEEGKSYKMTGLGSYVVIFTYNEGQLRFNVGDKVGTYTTGGVTFNTQIAMLTAAGGYNASSSTLHWLSSYEIVDSKLVVRFIPSNANYNGGAFGIGFYNASNTWGFISGRRYYADVVFYQK